MKSQIQFHGYDPAVSLIEVAPRPGESAIRTEDIEEFIAVEGEKIALVMLGGVNYYSGQAFDFSRITKAGRDEGSFGGSRCTFTAHGCRIKTLSLPLD